MIGEAWAILTLGVILCVLLAACAHSIRIPGVVG